MVNSYILKEQFFEMTRPLINLSISRAWRGYGSAIGLEFGKLQAPEFRFGEYSLLIQWSWRVERPQSILFGSFSSGQKINNNLRKLEGLKVIEITVEGRLPELVIQLSQKFWVHSFTTVEGQPEWFMRVKNGKWLFSKYGKLVIETEN